MRQNFGEYNSNSTEGHHADAHHQHEPFHAEDTSKNVNSNNFQYNNSVANSSSTPENQNTYQNYHQPLYYNEFQPNGDLSQPAPQPNNFQPPPHAPSGYANPTYAQPQQPYPPNNAHNKKGNKESKENNNNEIFIIIALLSSVIITSLIIGFGWTLFSPKQKTPNITQSAPASLPTQSQSTDNEIIDTTENTAAIENQENNDLIIMYGTEPVSTISQTPTTETVQPTPPKPTPPKVAEQPAPRTTPAPQVVSAPPVPSATPPAPSSVTVASITVPTPSLPAAPSTYLKTLYWIQVFSTTNRDRANQVQQDILAYGLNTQIVTKTFNDALHYRLRIGPFQNKAEGNKFLSWVKSNNNYGDAFLVSASKN